MGSPSQSSTPGIRTPTDVPSSPDLETMANFSVDSALDAGDLAGEQRALLDLVDKLQFAQLDDVKLPQIVVVGDQSAGKSSVLEAITGTPFPRDAGACTRFATEIRMRRSAEPSLAVSIIPDRNRPYRDQERLRQFGSGVDASLPFETLMRQAVELIAPRDVPGRFAARDILVVEKRGPDMPLLTLVDLPGLVRNANNDQSAEDIKTIEALSNRYMKSPRTIILAVVGGNSDYVQAPILTKARRFDPTGARTLGVLTKPDLTESIGLEDKFIELVQNCDRRNYFKLGWFVLLNPGPREPGQAWPTARERRQREQQFFARGKWAALPETMCGAAALKQTLSVQLQRHIGRHVKTLRRQIQAALDGCEADLKALGEGKDTPEEMRVELVQLFSDSKELVIPAVYGIYKNPPRRQFFRSTADPNGTPAQNLRARATEENDKFSSRVRTHGRKFSFSPGTPAPRAEGQDGAAAALPPNDSGKQDFARQEVEMLLRQIRGSEFPMDPKPRAVYMLFQSYAEYWPRLAQEHKDNLGVVCNEFLSEVVDFCWPLRMREPLRRQVLDPYMRKLMAEAQEELGRLGQDMQLEIQPYDPEYEERLRNWHVEATREGGVFTEAQEVLEKMLIYYELSAKSFIRNVITQVVERHLLQGMYGIFNSMDILRMTNDEVEAIAAENKETRDRRLALKAQKKAIEEAKDICASLAMRKELRQYAEEGELEDTSGDEGEPKTPSRRDSAMKPSIPRERRRSTRTLREERPQSATPAAAPIAETPTATYPTHQIPQRVEVPQRSPAVEWADHAAADQFYKAAPAQAPPPPPRPEKLRAEAAGEMGLPTPPGSAQAQQRATPGGFPQTQGRESDEYARYGGEGEYSAGRKVSRNKFFGRGS